MDKILQPVTSAPFKLYNLGHTKPTMYMALLFETFISANRKVDFLPTRGR